MNLIRSQLARTVDGRRAGFYHALRSLCHPGAIAAVLAVLVNDHWLRHAWPSWFTGKIGDFAWLVFAPLVLAALLVWITPARIAAVPRRLGLLAFGLVGLEFALAKTVPLFHTLTVRAYEFVIASPSTLRLDPTDLITLPALGLGWLIWSKPPLKAPALPSAGWVVLSLAVVATLADSGPADYGVSCLGQANGDLYTTGGIDRNGDRHTYVSHDGGLDWQPAPAGTQQVHWGNCEFPTQAWQMADPANPAVRYQFAPGVGIDKSTDGGLTWHTEVDLTREQAHIMFQDKVYNGSYGSIEPGPRDALIDSKTHAVVVAMGQEGLLVGTPDGQWRWVALGQDVRAQPSSLGDFVYFLQTELWAALVLALLVIGASFWRIERLKRRNPVTCPFGLIFVAGSAAWFWSAIIGEPAAVNNSGELAPLLLLPLWLAAFVGVPAAIAVSLEMFQTNRKALWVVLGTAAGCGVLYLVPIFIWAVGGIPGYGTASIYGGVLVVAVLFAGDRYLQQVRRQATKPEGLPE